MIHFLAFVISKAIKKAHFKGGNFYAIKNALFRISIDTFTGVQPPTPIQNSGGGGGCDPPSPNPLTLAPLAHENISIHCICLYIY